MATHPKDCFCADCREWPSVARLLVLPRLAEELRKHRDFLAVSTDDGVYRVTRIVVTGEPMGLIINARKLSDEAT